MRVIRAGTDKVTGANASKVQRMIPRTIHYIWLGKRRKSWAIRECMRSWRRHLADFRFVEWNESNLNLAECTYIAEASEAGYWAFVSDYFRLKVVYELGGVYLDTDCLVLRSLEPFLRHRFFSGFESDHAPFTAVFGAEAGHPLLQQLLRHYDGKHFRDENGGYDTTTNTVTVSRVLCREFGCRPDGTYQELREGIAIYPAEVLCRYSPRSVVVHLMDWSWGQERMRRLHRLLGGGRERGLVAYATPLAVSNT